VPRIPFPDPEELSAAQLESWRGQLNVGKMCAYMPDDVLQGFRALGRAVLTNKTLDPVLRELAIVRVGYLCGAAYEIHQHVQYGRNIGITQEKLAALSVGSKATAFSARERAVLAFTEELVLNVRPSDAALAAVRQNLSIAEIFTLIASVGMYMMVCRVLETTGVELDPDGVVVDPHAPR
jgi:alkylhydroperoxidase family enzyme